MGKKRITTESGSGNAVVAKTVVSSSKKKLASGVFHIEATYNNTKILLTDLSGNAYLWSSSGSLGFRGAKKGTPFAAGRVAELLADRSQALGLKEIDVILKGVGAGREAAIRAFSGKGLVINNIKDVTPVPFNGPKPKKPRRV
ncbi:30S ribosomal protein S11 [Candidatus Nomurabacteria bacterium]|nr:30S ribosomal protein S11 [Candidatus Nomurabacteria bacterium]